MFDASCCKKIRNNKADKSETSFLGSHGISPEYKSNPNKYIEDICLPVEIAHEEDWMLLMDFVRQLH